MWPVKTINPAKKPKLIDIKVADGTHKGTAYKGTYELVRSTGSTRAAYGVQGRKRIACALSEFEREKEIVENRLWK